MAAVQSAPATKRALRAALAAERREILELYQNLAPAEWDQMTLCTLWTARDLLAHLITNDTPFPALLLSGFNADRANQRQIAQLQAWSHAQLLDAWAHHVIPRGAPAAAPGAYLADDWVHHQDVRWPHNRPRQHDPARLRLVLDEVARLNQRRSAGLHLVARDLGWERGTPSMPEVLGDAEALAMGIANRPTARACLTGSGLDQLVPSA